MKCDRCDKPATLHLTQVVNDKVTKVHLCAECAKNAGLQEGSVTSIAQYLLGEANSGAVPRVAATPRNKVCPQCRMTLARFRKEGRLGCPACYAAFAEELDRILRDTHGACEHHGRQPGRPTRADWHAARMRLEDRLKEAVAAEAYEDAARLRDEIRGLVERHGDGGGAA